MRNVGTGRIDRTGSREGEGPPVRSRAAWIVTTIQIGALTFGPVIDLWARNHVSGPDVGRLALVAAAVAAFALLAALLMVFVLAMPVWRTGVVVSTALLLFFNWGEVRRLARASNALPDPREDLFVAALAVAVILLAVRFGGGYVLRFGVVGIALAVGVVPAADLASRTTSRPASIAVASPVAPWTGRDRPDVFFLMLDGYARADVLADVYGFDNGPFLGALRARGFIVADGATANYPRTPLSLASMLAMDYVLGPGRTLGAGEYRSVYRLTHGSNPVAATLRGAGYRSVHVESGWVGTRCGPDVDECHRSAFLDDAVWGLLDRTPLSRLLTQRYGHALVQGGLHSLEQLHGIARAPSAFPRYVFAHVLLPHPPLVLDARCRKRVDPKLAAHSVNSPDPRLVAARRAGFVEQTRCVNGLVLRALDALPPETIVFLTADHGPDSLVDLSGAVPSWPPESVLERLAVLSAYRVPERCRAAVRPSASVVNGFRIVLGCVAGRPLPLLRDRHFLLTVREPGDAERVSEVTVPVE